jgi:Cdc6-like AAA superfamily ATPase
MSTEETMDQNLEAMLGAEAAAATNPIQTSIKGLSKEQRAVLKDMVDRTIEEQDGGGPDVVARRYLVAESQLNAELVHAFDQRYSSPQALRQANKVIGKALDHMVAAARREPDANATEDRLAVAQAVRVTSTKIPEKPPVKYGDLSDLEFARQKSQIRTLTLTGGRH